MNLDPMGEPRPPCPGDEVDEVLSCCVDHYGCSDGAAARSQYGQAGCAHLCPCWYCDALNTEMCDVDERTSSRWTKRTIEKNELLAHLRTGFCEGCQCHIVSSQAMIKNEKKKAAKDKRAPRPMMVVLPMPNPAKANDERMPKTPTLRKHVIGHTRPGYCVRPGSLQLQRRSLPRRRSRMMIPRRGA